MNLLLFLSAVFFSSFLSGLTGLGGGVLLLTVMLPMFPVNVVIPLHGAIQLTSNSSRILLSFKDIDLRIFLLFTLGAILGSLIALPVDLELDSSLLRFVIATVILFFTWVPSGLIPSQYKGNFFILGTISSFLSTFIGSTGPLTAPFFLNSELEKSSYIATKAACQLPVHLLKIILYILSGFILKEWLFYILLALPLVITGNILGKFLTNKIDGTQYKTVVKAVITLLVVRMLLKILIQNLRHLKIVEEL